MYEQERDKRIEENGQKLQELQLGAGTSNPIGSRPIPSRPTPSYPILSRRSGSAKKTKAEGL